MATYDWTICIIAQVDNHPEVKEKYDKFLNVIKSVPPNARIKYIILEYSNEPGTGAAIVIHKLVKTVPEDDFTESLPRPASNDLYQKQTLIDFFNLHVLNESSDRHMLITWGHGAGLGFFTEKLASEIQGLKGMKGIKEMKGINKELDAFQTYAQMELHLRVNGYDKNVKLSMKESMKDYLEKAFTLKDGNKGVFNFVADFLDPVFEYKYIPIDDFSETLRQSFGAKGIKINLMFTLNCYMQMMETGYTLKDDVEILVAPASAIPFKGIDFPKLFNAISALPSSDPQLKPDTIAAGIVEDYPALYKGDKDFKKFYYRLSANYPGKYERILEGIDYFCEFFKSRRSALFNSTNSGNLMAEEHIRNIRETCDDQTTGDQNHFIPVAEFFNKMHTRFRQLAPLENSLVKHSRSIYDQADSAILASFPKKESDSIMKDTLPFVTIFFPDKRNSDENFVAYFLKTLFNDDRPVFAGHPGWDSFVYTYVDAL